MKISNMSKPEYVIVTTYTVIEKPSYTTYTANSLKEAKQIIAKLKAREDV